MPSQDLTRWGVSGGAAPLGRAPPRPRAPRRGGADAYRKAIAHDGFMEEAHRGLMRCHAALGQRGRAPKHYEELVELLEEKLGIPPAPETRALHERLRATGEEV